MESIKSLIVFLEKLEENKIHYTLNKIRDSILVEIVVPGQRWEVEFIENGNIEIEKFTSDGTIYDSSELDTLFGDFSDS